VVESIGEAKPPAPEKPALLKGGMILCWIYAVVLMLTVAMLPMLDEMARVDTNATGGTPGTAQLQSQFASTMRPASQFFVIPLLVVSIAVAYGLAKDRYWSRMMMMTLLILGVVLIPPPMANPAMYALSVALAVFGWWYLYRKPNVTAYYSAIRPGNCN
jgi:hypothetical protein